MSDVPSIPSLPTSVDPSVRRAFGLLQGWIDGIRKSGGTVTQQQLVSAGLLDSKGALAISSGFLNTATPPKITGLVVTGAFRTIILEWSPVAAGNIAYVEVWRHTADVIGEAQRVGTTNANAFSDLPPNSSLSVTYYYWVRAVNTSGVVGPWNSTAGTAGKTADDPAYVLEVLSDEITESQLYLDLNERINLIDAEETGLVPRMAAAESSIQTETTARTDADTALAQSISTLQTTVGQNSSAIQTETTARTDADTALAQSISTLQTTVGENTTSLQSKAEVSALNAVYEVKFDIDGRVTGFGMVGGAESTEFGILADRFWIADPDSSAYLVPFIVDNGTVYLDTASIKVATITSAMIETVAADKIVATALSAITANLGAITSGTITLSNTSSWMKSSNYVAGSAGFLIRGDGFAEFQNIKARGDVEATSLKSDTLMVNSGNIHELAVDTLHIADEAVTVPVSAQSDAKISVSTEQISDQAWTTVISFVIDSEGQPISVVSTYDLSTRASDSLTLYARYLIGGTVILTRTLAYELTAEGSYAEFRTPSFTLSDKISGTSGSQTVTIQMSVVAGNIGASNETTVAYRRAVAIGVKK